MNKKRPSIPEPTIGELIERKRAAGPDREFEELLSKPWICPHCHHRTTILGILIPVGTGDDAACPKCKRPGIQVFEPAEAPQ